MRKIILTLLLMAPLPVKAECYGIAGLQLNRYVWDSETEKPSADGKSIATAGYMCQVLSGDIYSLDVGGSLGTIVDSQIFGPESSTVGLNIGVNYDGLITAGAAPHYIIGESLGDSQSFGLGFFVSFRLDAWSDFFGKMFADGVQGGIEETSNP